MPSQSLTAALLLLGKDGLPWGTPTWQSLTRIHGEPWATAENAPDDSLALHVPEWTTRVAKHVKAFATKVWGMAPSKQDAYVAKRAKDNDSVGRTAWATFVSKRSGQWGINKIVDDVLVGAGRSPAQVLREFKAQELPFAEAAQIYEVQGDVAQKLFGDDAYVGAGSLLKPAISKFCRAILTLTWNRYRKGVTRDVQTMDSLYGTVTELWKAFSAEGAKPAAPMIRSFLKDLRKLLNLYVRYDDAERRARVEQYMTDMVEMLKVIRKEPGSENTDKLPKNLREALRNLASEDDITAVTQYLLATMEEMDGADADERVDLDLDAPLDPDWTEGVENLSKLTDDSLWQKLGLADKRIPFFQRWTDPDGLIDPWSPEGQAWLNTSTSKRHELEPRWHQLVGIYRMLERTFEGKPVLLMDGVGLGKTLQVLGTIACLAYYRHVYKEKGVFPGDFAERKLNTPDGNIPDLPHIIVCPVNLRQQWESEIKRFLSPGSFDVLPYINRLDSRGSWWSDLFHISKQPLPRRIILATQTAIQDDAVAVFNSQTVKEKAGHAIPGARYESVSPRTVYGQKYGLVIMDEAHCARKHNHIHRAFRGLRERTTALVAMTATPITTKAQDLYIMGQWMGVPNFDDHKEFLELNKEINRANRQDSKALREAGIEGNIIRGVFIGVRNQNTPAMESPTVTRDWMIKMRERFAPHVIRRTIDSVDFAGKKLFGMLPYQEHTLKLQMYDWEMGALRSFAKDLVKENPIASVDTRKNFYIEFRRSMLHPMLNPKNGGHWKKPESLEKWQNTETTIKLDTLARVVHHHLEKNGRAPLATDDDGKTLTQVPNAQDDDHDYGDDDRIVIYSAFPSSNQAIVDILSLYGIEVIELNGTMTLKKRQAAIDDFRTSTRMSGHRVLIISNVGMVGLNLACANIMVIVDTTWSALDDEQLRGRIFRYPQKKQVHFYRLIALGTPDVFLNNISFDKGQLHSAFVGCAREIQGLFEPDQVDDGSVLSVTSTPAVVDIPRDDDDDDDDHSETPKTKTRAVGGKPRGGKSAKAKGKGKKSRQIITSDDEVEVNEPGPSVKRTPEKKGGNAGRSKRLHSSPTGGTTNKKSRRKRGDTVTDTTAVVTSLTEAAAAMQVDAPRDTATQARGGDQDTAMTDIANPDPVLEALNAVGGQNDPDEDEQLARGNLRLTSEGPSPLTPLTPLSASQDSQPSGTYSGSNNCPNFRGLVDELKYLAMAF
ncbi:P-loop containing nucleoside triphosphate hydrolase protein [Pisolithus microcarpus]|nr:P-loop containing nucleoside triphosphate hydrolase protein [Pisolithus microcarpus]